MTTLQMIGLTCPVCETEFRSQSVLSTNSFGGKRTDFHEKAAGAQPLPFLVHTCLNCGYSGTEYDFSKEADVDSELRRYVLDQIQPRLPVPDTQAGSVKYEFAALIAERRDRETRAIADFYLRAAWCCVDEDDTEAERYFRRLAACKFAECLAAFDDVKKDERAVLTYLVGELWRRIGDKTLSDIWFDRVASEITDLSAQQWVVDAARQQKERPQEWFG